jgi:mono/diheme cytochrome c family protein
MFMRDAGQIAAVACVAIAGSLHPATAQLPTFGVGRPPTSEEINAWDLTVGPDGKNLPPGSGTAADGRAIFEQRCATCHGAKGDDPKYYVLVGGRGTLAKDEPLKTIGSFWPYATTVWSYIRRAQPLDAPGSLTADQVYAVTAYLLHLNGIVGETDIMDARTLPQVRMPNREGFVSDPRPDVGKLANPKKR